MQPPAEGLVQELLAQTRQLKVENERLRLELQELRAGEGRPDPRLGRLEAENQRLRDELAAARAARDDLRSGLEELERKLSRI